MKRLGGGDGKQPEPELPEIEKDSETLQYEVVRVKHLREDVLLLRYHLARRTDLATIIAPNDRLASEAALNASLEVLASYARKEDPPIGHVAAASASLLDAVDKLVTAARMAQEQDGTGEESFPVTPESLRACLPERDIACALGLPAPEKKRETASAAKRFLLGKVAITAFWFFVALLVHAGTVLVLDNLTIQKLLVGTALSDTSVEIAKEILIPMSAFFWALVGSLVWILVRFRRFGAAYAFDPAHAEVFKARVLSGAITTAVLMYFVFGGKLPWATNWKVDLPLWAFVMGYAGKLQVQLLASMVDRVQGAISGMVGGRSRAGRSGRAGGKGGGAGDQTRQAPASSVRAPETKDPQIGFGGDEGGASRPGGRG